MTQQILLYHHPAEELYPNCSSVTLWPLHTLNWSHHVFMISRFLSARVWSQEDETPMKTLPLLSSSSSSNSQLVRSLADPLSFSHVKCCTFGFTFHFISSITYLETKICILVKNNNIKFGMYFLSNASEYFNKNSCNGTYMFSV